MIDLFFTFLAFVEDSVWSYLCFPMIMILGAYFSVKSGFVQVRKFPTVVKTFFSFLIPNQQTGPGVHPIKTFFACLGGCVGIGNLVAICSAVQLGGPGALLWVWITALVGMVLKYSEVYLGMRYRVVNPDGSYSGGPMYFLRRAFKAGWIPSLIAFLLCIYGVEIYQFGIVVNSLTTNFDIHPYIATSGLLALVIFAGMGGINRVGQISSTIIPIFILLYLLMGGWILFQHLAAVPSLMKLVFTSAFTGHAAVGGFVGSGLMMTISQGLRRGCYSGDVGIGYASIIHSESSNKIPERQASLTIFDIFLDTFVICTTSILIILITGVWKEPIHESMLIQTALANYFPYMHFFMPFFLFLLGYSTIIAFFCVGIKCAEYLSPKWGKALFYVLGSTGLVVFSFFGTAIAMSVMALTGALLLIINLYGIFKLRHEISFNIDTQEADVTTVKCSLEGIT